MVLRGKERVEVFDDDDDVDDVAHWKEEKLLLSTSLTSLSSTGTRIFLLIVVLIAEGERRRVGALKTNGKREGTSIERFDGRRADEESEMNDLFLFFLLVLSQLSLNSFNSLRLPPRRP